MTAARVVFSESGSKALMSDVAERANVGNATLYRHFPDRASLIRAVLDRGFDEYLAPVIAQAVEDDDPYRALVTVLEATLTLAEHDRNLLTVALEAGAISTDLYGRFVDSTRLLLRRAQHAGTIRGDIVADDIVNIMVMLRSVTMTPNNPDGWRRYLSLILAGLDPRSTQPLPPALPLPETPPGNPDQQCVQRKQPPHLQ